MPNNLQQPRITNRITLHDRLINLDRLFRLLYQLKTIISLRLNKNETKHDNTPIVRIARMQRDTREKINEQ